VAASAGFRLLQDGDACSYFLLGQGCWSWWRLCTKMRSVENISSYHMSMFKEFYNKLLAIKKPCCKFFWATLVLHYFNKLNSKIF
jgi:hypothetical protein